ncbi:protein phosphatase 2C domain-containing protein [Actinokineospora sp. NPDC004072]
MAYVFGEPGRAFAAVVPAPDPEHWHRPDTVVDGYAVHRGDRTAHVRAASVRGLSHRCYGKVRQDEYLCRTTPDGRHLLVAVADGVSAGPLSHRAARWAVRLGTDYLCEILSTLDDIPWGKLVEVIAAEIAEFGGRVLGAPGLPAREVAEQMAATVSFAVLDLETGALDGASVGDTSIWLLREGWRPLQPVKNDGAVIHTSAVRALPLPGEPVVVSGQVEPGDVLVVLSDGVGDPLGDGTGEVGAALAELWRTPPPELEFAAQVGFARKTYDDDRTAVAVWV